MEYSKLPYYQTITGDSSRIMDHAKGVVVHVGVSSPALARSAETQSPAVTKLKRLVQALKSYYGKSRRQAEKTSTHSPDKGKEREQNIACCTAASGQEEDGGDLYPPTAEADHSHQRRGELQHRRRHSNPDIGMNCCYTPRSMELQRIIAEVAEPVRPTSVYAVHKQLRRHHKDNLHRASDPGSDAVATSKSIWMRRHNSVISLPLLEDAPWDPITGPNILGGTSYSTRHLRKPSWNLPESCVTPSSTDQEGQPLEFSYELCDADDVFLESELPSRQSSFQSSGSFSSQYSRKSSWRSYSESLESAASRQTYIKTSPKFHKRRETDSEAVTNLGLGASCSGPELDIVAREVGLSVVSNNPSGSPGRSSPLDAGPLLHSVRSAASSPRGSPTSAKSSHPAVRLRRLRSQTSYDARFYDEPRPVLPVRPGMTVYDSASGSRSLRKLRSMPAAFPTAPSDKQVSGKPVPRSLSSASTATRRRELSFS